MRDKFLYPSTIISEDLYVERQADKHLQNVIQHGGRPAYILVSRQMGKTNLLLHAKAKMEDENNLFVYVDLSIKSETAAMCFRNIIDTAILSRPAQLAHLQSLIDENRTKQFPAHKEHENELRLILNSISGKLVIILDEVDSLRNQSFSDQLFAQIRSTYFSRVNFSDFKRLTYVLSGVAEPSDLIKDKNISPFNIGEKIYLDDFTKDEFYTFLRKAKLEIPSDAAEQVFHWSNGNPRITWDICSSLENSLIEGKALSASLVDEEIANMYLGQFDLAPVDHIRRLVQDDDDLHNAIVVIRYKKGDTLSDEVKSKLFLAGIIQAPTKGKPVKIKNIIIEHALSDQWLEEVAKTRKPIWQMAFDSYNDGAYPETIRIIESNLENLTLATTERKRLLSTLGLSYFHLGKYKDALKNFIDATPESSAAHPSEYYESIYYQGLCYYSLDNTEKAISLLRQALESPVKETTYFSTKIDLAVIISKEEKHRPEAIQLIIDAKNDILATYSTTPPERYRDILIKAIYNLPQIVKSTEEKTVALANIDEIIPLAKPLEKLALLFHKLDLRKEGKKETILEIRDNIVSFELLPLQTSSSVPDYNINHFFKILVQAHANDRVIFNELVEFYQPRLAKIEMTMPTFCEGILENAGGHAPAQLAIDLHRVLSPVTLNKYDLIDCYRVGLLKNIEATNPMFFEYADVLYENPANLGTLDFILCINRLDLLFRLKMLSKVIRTIDVLKQILRNNDPLLKYQCLVHYNETRLQIAHQNEANAKKFARLAYDGMSSIIDAQDLSGDSDDAFITKEFILPKHSSLKSYLFGAEKKTPARSSKAFKPNDWITVKYADGSLKRNKFKRLTEDLATGACEVIASESDD